MLVAWPVDMPSSEARIFMELEEVTPEAATVMGSDDRAERTVPRSSLKRVQPAGCITWEGVWKEKRRWVLGIKILSKAIFYGC